jgi:hypothetical protein
MSDTQNVASSGDIESSPSDTVGTKLRLGRPHPLIKRTLDIKVEKDPYGFSQQPAWPGVDIRVSKVQKRNALIILDRLFKALEQRDIEPSVSEGDHGGIGTYAVSGRDKVKVYVEEQYKKEPHKPTAKELRDKEQYPHLSRIPKYDSVPTGVLTLVPGGVVDITREEALAKLVAKSTEDIIRQLEEERTQREAAEAKSRQEWERQRQNQEEKARVEALHKAAAAFRQYRDLMDYIEEVRRFGRVPDDQRKEGQTVDDWLRWAEWRARCIHPLG